MATKRTAVYGMHRDGWLGFFELHVSPNARAMRQHILAAHRKERLPVPKDGFADTEGMVHPKIPGSDGCFAICYLHEGELGVGVVTHECLHVAMAHERYLLRFGMNYGPGIDGHEERLCHFLMDIVASVYDTLYDHGHIKRPKVGRPK